MLLLIKAVLSYIDDQNVNCTFIIYESVRLLILLKRDPKGQRLLSSSVYLMSKSASLFYGKEIKIYILSPFFNTCFSNYFTSKSKIYIKNNIYRKMKMILFDRI